MSIEANDGLSQVEKRFLSLCRPLYLNKEQRRKYTDGGIRD